MVDIGTLSLILLIAMFVLLAIGMPLGFASAFLAVVTLVLKFGPDLLFGDFGRGPLNVLAQAIYRQMTTDDAFSADATSAGRRALRNAVLTLLMARGEKSDIALATRHFDRATNMTDEAHALFLLAATSGAARDKALDRFFERWKHDHLVIDTWFTAQAVSPLPATVKRVTDLISHPLFSITTPNKVRALVGNFATLNPVQFNRPDGAGYAFVSDQVLAIDRFNPQIAARILGVFRSWRSLEPARKRQARKALARVAATPHLSRDVYEIVSRMLDG